MPDTKLADIAQIVAASSTLFAGIAALKISSDQQHAGRVADAEQLQRVQDTIRREIIIEANLFAADRSVASFAVAGSKRVMEPAVSIDAVLPFQQSAAVIKSNEVNLRSHLNLNDTDVFGEAQAAIIDIWGKPDSANPDWSKIIETRIAFQASAARRFLTPFIGLNARCRTFADCPFMLPVAISGYQYWNWGQLSASARAGARCAKR